MEIKELKAAIEEAAKELSEKSQGAVSKAESALKKATEALEKAEKGVDADFVKSQLESIKVKAADGNEYSFQEAVDLLQKQHDKLSVIVGNKANNQQTESKSFEQTVADTLAENQEKFEKFARKEIKNFDIEFKAVGDMSTTNVTGGSRYGQIYAPRIIENPKRKVHVEDLLPGGNIGPGNSFTFMRENGVGEGNPAPVAEGATKPQFDLDLVESTVQIETIAGWVRVTRKAMNNIPGFMSFLNSRLPEKFKRVKDQQFLYGTGTTPQIKGILTSGNFVESTYTTASPLVERITGDIAVLEDTYERTATGVLLRPIDILPFYENKATGSGEYDLPRNVTFVNGQLYISGVPVYMSTAVNAGDYVVGDWLEGAQVLTQEAMRIEVFEQDGTNVRENKITIRIEGNYALPVYGPDYFIKGTTDAVVEP